MPLIDCLGKAKEVISEKDRQRMMSRSEALKKEGFDSDAAERKAVQEYVSEKHKDLHDQLNKLKTKAGLKAADYKPLAFKEPKKQSAQDYTTQKGLVVSRENGERVVKDSEGSIVTGKRAKDALDEHAQNYNYNQGATAAEKVQQAPEFSSDTQAKRFAIENSENPSEIADIYTKEEKQPVPLSAKEQAIYDHGIGKVTEKSYRQFGDKNNKNNSKARTYFSSKGESIDVVAKSISDHTGLDVTPQDIVDFIDRFPSGGKVGERLQENEVHQIAKDRFKELTGIPLTDDVATTAAIQLYAPEAQKAATDYVDSHWADTEAMPESELEKWNREAFNEIQNENSNLDYGQSHDSTGEQDNAQPRNEGQNAPVTDQSASGNAQDDASAGNPTATPEATEPDSTRPTEAERGTTEANPEVTGIKNAVTKAEREARGLSEVQTTELKRGFGEVFDKAKSAVDSGEMDPRAFAQHIAEHPRPLSAEESAALIYDRMRISNEHRIVMSAIEEALNNEDKDSETVLRSRLISLEDAMNTNDIAARKTGYEQGLGLAIRSQMIQQDYSLARQLQVMRVANNGKPIPESLRMKLEGYTKDLEKAMQKIQEHEEKISKLESERELSGYINAEKEARKQNRQIKREDNKKVRETAINNIKEKLRIQRNQMNSTPIPVEIIPDLLAIAKSYIKDGLLKADEIVEKVRDDVKDFIEGVTNRDIRDALSGYGKVRNLSKDELDVKLRDLKGQMRETSKLEDLEAKEAPKRSGMQRETPSDELRELRRKVYQKMKEEGLSTRTTEDAQRTALDAVKARLRNQIADLEKQLETGEKSPKKVGVAYDEEASRLKEERDNLKTALEAIEGKPELSPEQRIKIATAAVEKSIKEYERRIAEKDLNPKKKESKTPETDELSGLKAKRDALKADYEKMVDDATPKKSPTEIALQAYKTRLESRKAELETKIANGDYSTKPRNKVVPDAEALRLQNEVEKVKEKFDLEKRKFELANRSTYEKGLDWLVKWRRGVALTGVTTLGKLGSAAAGRIIISPIEELYGGIISKIPGISYIAGKAPREGGFDIHAEAQAISKAFSKETLENMWDLLKTGKSKEDRLFGKRKGDDEQKWYGAALDFFGRIHGAIKYTAKKAEITRAFEKRIAFAAKNGFDVTDPVVQATVWSQSYLDANRAIFMNENLAMKGYRGFLDAVEQRGGGGGKFIGAAARMLLPIVKVPTNFVLETSHYAFGLPKAAASIAYAFTKGMQNLSPEHADYIMRMLKKGSIGAALFAVGYLNPEHFGGYYTGKRDEEDKQPKDMDLYGVTIPHWAQHLPVLEVMQLGATIRRVKDSHEAKNEGESGLGSGALKGAVGLIGETPFFDQSKRSIESFENTKKFANFWGEFSKSAIDPQIIQQIAEQMDKENGQVVKRKPETFIQHIETGIPVFRKQVPKKEEDTGGGLTRSLLP